MQKIKLADHVSKNQEGIKVSNKRDLPPAYIRQLKEMADKRAKTSECLRKIAEMIESNKNKNNSGSDTPGGQALKILSDDVIIAKLAAVAEYFGTIEDLSDEEKSILTELTSVTTLLTSGDVISDPLQQVREVIKKAEVLKIAATGKGFDIDQSIYIKQISIFADNGQKSNLTFKDAAEAAKKFMKKPSNKLNP